MKYLYLLIISLLTFSACSNSSDSETIAAADTTSVTAISETPAVIEPETAALEKRQLKNLDLTIEIKEQMQIQDYGDFQMVCTSENVKSAKCFTIEFYKSTAKTYETWGKQDLGDGKLFYFKTSQEVSPAGGKDENLEGVLLVGSKTYLIKSSDHSEGGAPNAKWCFQYLKNITLL